MNLDRKTLADELEALRDGSTRMGTYDIAFKCADNIDTILAALRSSVAGEDDIAGIILYGIVDDWENGALSQESYENAKKLSRVLAKRIVSLATPPTGESAPNVGERAHKAARENLREAWAALAMIRETVETLGPVGAMKASEHLDGPTFMHEADEIVAGIKTLASPSAAGNEIQSSEGGDK